MFIAYFRSAQDQVLGSMQAEMDQLQAGMDKVSLTRRAEIEEMEQELMETAQSAANYEREIVGGGGGGRATSGGGGAAEAGGARWNGRWNGARGPAPRPEPPGAGAGQAGAGDNRCGHRAGEAGQGRPAEVPTGWWYPGRKVPGIRHGIRRGQERRLHQGHRSLHQRGGEGQDREPHRLHGSHGAEGRGPPGRARPGQAGRAGAVGGRGRREAQGDHLPLRASWGGGEEDQWG